MADPQRRSPVRKPTVLKTRKYLVRLWEVERKHGAVPSQIRGFEVEANAIHKARDLVRFELSNTRRRVVRALSLTTDQVFTAVVFKNEVRVERPSKPSEFPLKRDSAAERVEIAAAHAVRRSAVRKHMAAQVIDLAAERKKRDTARKKQIAESRKKQAAEKEQTKAKRKAERAEERKAAQEAQVAAKKKRAFTAEAAAEKAMQAVATKRKADRAKRKRAQAEAFERSHKKHAAEAEG